jgi:hypothetical protein
MKKLLLIGSIFLILGVTIFYFGWIQLKVDKDEYGIVFTKVRGYLDKPLVPGKFSWSAAALIPKNIEITTIPAAPRTVFISSRQDLPSNAEYGSVVVGKADFSYSVDFYVSFFLKSDYAVVLVRDKGFTAGTIESWYEAMEKAIESAAMKEIRIFFDNTAASQSSVFLSDADQEKLRTRVQRHFDQITVSDLDFISISLPDLELYETAKAYYQELSAVKNSSLQKEMIETAKQRAENEVQIDLLKRYGSLFEEFPILIDYIKADPDLKSLSK